MTPAELTELRKKAGASQSMLADAIGMSLRNYQNLESGTVEIRQLHDYAIRYALLNVAVALENPMLAPPAARKLALDFARLVEHG